MPMPNKQNPSQHPTCYSCGKVDDSDPEGGRYCWMWRIYDPKTLEENPYHVGAPFCAECSQAIRIVKGIIEKADTEILLTALSTPIIG